MLVSATNYEALPGARPDGSMRIELFAMVAGTSNPDLALTLTTGPDPNSKPDSNPYPCPYLYP